MVIPLVSFFITCCFIFFEDFPLNIGFIMDLLSLLKNELLCNGDLLMVLHAKYTFWLFFKYFFQKKYMQIHKMDYMLFDDAIKSTLVSIFILCLVISGWHQGCIMHFEAGHTLSKVLRCLLKKLRGTKRFVLGDVHRWCHPLKGARDRTISVWTLEDPPVGLPVFQNQA